MRLSEKGKGRTLYQNKIVKVIIPACNEQESIGHVLAAVPAWVDEVLVVNNGSTDETSAIATAGGARVVDEPRRGYGQACLAGMAALGHVDIVVFLDGDFSDYPEEMESLVEPIVQDRQDMVIGSRALRPEAAEHLSPVQRSGNRLACDLMGLIWQARFSDLGPFRAIRASALRQLNMQDRNFGWTIEMQIKAVRAGLRCGEAAMRYRRRIGVSKISGTFKGVIGAGSKILWTVARQALAPTPIHRSRKRRLILFTRYPVPGKAKTRLIGELGAVQAAHLQKQLTEYTLGAVRAVADDADTEIEIRYAGGNRMAMRRWLGGGVLYRPQAQGDLGEKLRSAVRRAYREGCERVVVIGSDCPFVTADLIRQAFKALKGHQVVLGPSKDGGYWLIGVDEPYALFHDIPWGGRQVYERTLARIDELELTYHELATLRDIDEAEDLAYLPEGISAPGHYLSVIVPTLNEAEHLPRALGGLLEPGVEVIVVDGGSTDRTVEMAQGENVTLLSHQCGRARQMNAGAGQAGGIVLLFLHADTQLAGDEESGSIVEAVFRSLFDSDVAGGYFRLKIDADAGRTWRGLESLVAGCNQLLATAFGDQALFVRRSVFDAVGRYPDVQVGEDVLIVQRIRQTGSIVKAPGVATTSARRWQARGVLRTSVSDLIVLGGLSLGLPCSLLKKLQCYV